MNNKLIIILTIFLGLFLFGCVQDIPEPSDLKNCISDNDCIIVEGKECCACPDTINQKYENYWENAVDTFYTQNCQGTMCDIYCPTKNYFPTCQENKCTLKIIDSNYNFQEKQQIISKINSLEWRGSGKYMSGEEDVSDDIEIYGLVKIDLSDINQPCSKGDCGFGGFEIRLPTSYPEDTQEIEIDSNGALIVKNFRLRFSKVVLY